MSFFLMLALMLSKIFEMSHFSLTELKILCDFAFE
jgi:hypothetical protein